jgi:subtilisin family serine protease
MSFGWPSSDFDGQNALQTAIDRAFSKKVLLFAAASNSGGRLGRAYPASSPEVICAHSTDTYGNASKFSPTAKPHSINIGTVGEYIESAWPTLLCDDHEDDSQYLKTRSGTSYATPILAGIAAFLLQYARLHLPEEVALNLKRKDKMEALLKRCAERGPDYQPRDNYYYVELSLNKHNIFGQDVEGVNHEIMRALRT